MFRLNNKTRNCQTDPRLNIQVDQLKNINKSKGEYGDAADPMYFEF